MLYVFKEEEEEEEEELYVFMHISMMHRARIAAGKSTLK
jgi:hypothetical protein